MQADQVVRSTCPFCGVGCQVLLNVKDDHVFRIDAPFEAAPNFGRLCVKGRFGTDFIHHPNRLTRPLIRRKLPQPGQRTPAQSPADWREATWDEALSLVVTRLLQLRRQYGPDSLTCNVCAKATNEDNYLLQKYFRAVLGTNNVDHCTRLCHAGSVKALQLSLGTSAMSNAIAEMKDLECFIITGSNTAENHPVIATFLKEAVTHNGAKLIVIDPRQTEMVNFATLWLQQQPGSDTAVFNAMAHVIIKEKLHHLDFIARRTEGFSDYIESLEEKTPEWAEALSGVPAEQIRQAAQMYAQAGAAAIYWGMGISQSVHGTDNALTLINLALLTGHIGRPLTGLNPLRGQNNVQGCSDSGGMPTVFTAYQPVTDADIRRKFETAWHTALPGVPGLTTTEMVTGILAGQVKGWYVMGEDPLMSEPDLSHARHAVEQLEFYVAQDIFFNQSNIYADVILPAAAFAEKDGTFTNSDRRVQRVRRAVAAPGLARPDWEIVMDVAQRTLAQICRQTDPSPASAAADLDRVLCQNQADLLAQWNYPHPADIWDEMRQLTPDFYGLTYERLDREGGVHWPCPAADHPGSPYLFEHDFPRGRGKFFTVDYSNESEQPDEAYPLILSTGRLLYHWHGGSITRNSSLDEIWPECTVEMHPHDAAQAGLETGDWVDVSSRRGQITARLLVTPRSPQGTVFIPFHFAEAAANILTHHLLDERAKIPDYKVCGVNVARAVAVPVGRVGADIPLEDRGTIKDRLAV